MANSRVVNTNFWKDSYIIDLDKTEKLLFIYFLTNPRTTLAGIYEISLREVEFDTGIPAVDIQMILTKFQRDGKMYYERNWLVLANFIKHQRLNPSIIRGIEKAIDELPEWLNKKVNLQEDDSQQLSIFMTDSQQSVHNVSTDSPQLNIIKSNINKIKEKKEKHNADKPQGDSKEFSTAQKRSYAKASQADRDQQARAQVARKRKPSPPGKIDPNDIDEMYERRTYRG